MLVLGNSITAISSRCLFLLIIMLNYTKELLRSLWLFPSHYLLPQATNIKVIDLDIRRCSPTAGHNTCYRSSRGGKRVFKKLASITRSIAVNVSTKRTTTPNYSPVNLNNLHSIPTGTKINNNITTIRDKMACTSHLLTPDNYIQKQ